MPRSLHACMRRCMLWCSRLARAIDHRSSSYQCFLFWTDPVTNVIITCIVAKFIQYKLAASLTAPSSVNCASHRAVRTYLRTVRVSLHAYVTSNGIVPMGAGAPLAPGGGNRLLNRVDQRKEKKKTQQPFDLDRTAQKSTYSKIQIHATNLQSVPDHVVYICVHC